MSKSEWISVKEALPEPGETVLLFYETERVRLGRRWVFSFKQEFDFESTYGKVTHWCPIPAAPEV